MCVKSCKKTQDELAFVEHKNTLLGKSVESYRSKLRNIRKRFARLQLIAAQPEAVNDHTEISEMLAELSASSEQLEVELRECKRKLINEHQRVYYHRKKAGDTSVTVSNLQHELGEAKHEIVQCQKTIKSLEHQLESALDSAATAVLETKVEGQYTDDVRQCCLHLLSLNVGIRNVSPVIRAVLSLVGLSAVDLPSQGLLSQMYVELKQVSALHIAEQLSGVENTTLQSDGTSKFGRSYGAYEVATPSQVFTLGVVDMHCGTAEHVLEQLKQVVADIDEVAVKHGKSDVGKKIVGKLKNTMSDRCSVQKTFNELVEAYRSELLPDVVSGWSDLSDEEKASMMGMNNFFCGFHYIVGLADQAASSLKVWEAEHFGNQSYGATELPNVYQTDESRVTRLVRTATKCFEKHGDEAAGCVASFHDFLSRTNTKLHMADYRGNRNYVVFYNSAGLYSLHESMLHFLKNVHGETNQLLKAVRADLEVADLVAGVRALGIVNKLLVAPLWRALENRNITILKMSHIYTDLHSNLVKWSEDASPLLEGSARPFDSAVVPVSDEILNTLVSPAPSDDITLEILQLLAGNYATYTKRLLADHLPDGQFHTASPALSQETASVPNTNAVSERDFAQLDRLLRQKPNADTIALEGMLMFANNKTAQWLSAKSEEERSTVLEIARQSAAETRACFRARQEAIRTKRREMLKKREKEIEDKRNKELKRKEELTAEIATLGLWVTEEMIVLGLQSITGAGKQRAALRAQLLFRKFVLCQKAPNERFALSRQGRQLPLREMQANLSLLLSPPTPTAQSSTSTAGELALDSVEPSAKRSAPSAVGDGDHEQSLEPMPMEPAV